MSLRKCKHNQVKCHLVVVKKAGLIMWLGVRYLPGVYDPQHGKIREQIEGNKCYG
jgi:hypothetical protein